MQKYLYGFKLYFLNSFIYRFNTVIQTVFSNLRLIIIVFFWVLIYSGDIQKELNGFTLYGMITYLVFMDVFGSLIYGLRNTGFNYSNMIKNGTLGPALLKPRNLSMYVYFRNLADGVTSTIPQMMLVICIIPFIARFLVWDMDLISLASIILFLMIGTVSTHLMCSILGYMAFWFEEANAVMWSFMVLFNVLTGFFLPLDFFPKWSVGILEMLPFASWGYIQTKLYIGFYAIEKILLLFVVQIIWVCVLMFINKIIWSRGIKKYSAVGG